MRGDEVTRPVVQAEGWHAGALVSICCRSPVRTRALLAGTTPRPPKAGYAVKSRRATSPSRRPGGCVMQVEAARPAQATGRAMHACAGRVQAPMRAAAVCKNQSPPPVKAGLPLPRGCSAARQRKMRCMRRTGPGDGRRRG